MTLLLKAVALTLFLKITKSCVVCTKYLYDENAKALCKLTRLCGLNSIIQNQMPNYTRLNKSDAV